MTSTTATTVTSAHAASGMDAPFEAPFRVAAIQTVPGVGIKMVLHVGAMLYRRRAAS